MSLEETTTNLIVRSLGIAERLLYQVEGPLAAIARRHTHEARMSVETLQRLEARKS